MPRARQTLLQTRKVIFMSRSKQSSRERLAERPAGAATAAAAAAKHDVAEQHAPAPRFSSPGEDSPIGSFSSDDADYLFPRSSPAIHVDARQPNVPPLFTVPPPLKEHPTASSLLQDRTVQDCLPFLSGVADSQSPFNEQGLPRLQRAEHIAYLHNNIRKTWTPYDAARTWVLYWALCALTLLGEDVECYREQ